MSGVHGKQAREETLEQALGTLRAQGLRITKPRRKVLGALLASDVPLTARDLHEAVDGDCDLVTVYRCLSELERLELVMRHEFGDGNTHFEYQDGHTGHRHYVICRKCHRKEPIDVCPADWVEQTVRDKGYRNVSHAIEFFGVCPLCNGANERS